MPAMRTSLAADTHARSTETKEILSAQGTFSASRSSPREEGKRTVLTLAVAHLLESRLVAKAVLARLDNEGQTGSDGLGGLCSLGLLGGGHYD